MALANNVWIKKIQTKISMTLILMSNEYIKEQCGNLAENEYIIHRLELEIYFNQKVLLAISYLYEQAVGTQISHS